MGPSLAVALGDIARVRGLSNIARKTGLTREGFHMTIAKTGDQTFGTALEVASAVGLKLNPNRAA